MPARPGACPDRAHRDEARASGRQLVSPVWRPLRAEIPGGGHFFLTADAVEMISAFGGALHCYDGPGGCRRKGLLFSRTRPGKALRCHLVDGDASGPELTDPDGQALSISVTAALTDVVDGATLDFGSYTGRQRFAWTRLPALRTPPCTCRRSVGAPAGKRAPCLDENNVTFSDL